MGRHPLVNLPREVNDLLPHTEASAVAVPMMQVWIVRMLVGHQLMPMRMAVRLARWLAWVMLVLMMLVRNMAMSVLHRLIGMDMGMTLGEM